MSILIYPFKPKIDHGAREQLLRQKPRLLWFTGLSGSGKSTLAVQLEFELWELGYKTYLLDGDNVRAGLSKDLDFTDAGRIENIRRIGEVAKLFLDAGIIVLSAFISPFRSEREIVRNLAGEVQPRVTKYSASSIFLSISTALSPTNLTTDEWASALE